MTPEEKAREQIDAMLVASGWTIQDYKVLNLSAGMRVNQTDATAVRRREGMPSGFVNCAADDTAPFRLARMLRVGSNSSTRRFRSSWPMLTSQAAAG
jgi:hypothetical protein